MPGVKSKIWGQTLPPRYPGIGSDPINSIEKVCKGCTAFEKEVLKVVAKIPFGQTRSYGWVAKKVGRPRAVRAVGQALKKNSLPLLIPCHRVVRSDGKIGGYKWGKALKLRLLDYEKSKVNSS